MRLPFTFILFLLLNNIHSQTSIKVIPDSITYELINVFCKDRQLKRIHKIPIRYIYGYEIKSDIDTNKTLSGFDYFFYRIKENDTAKFFINYTDLAFLRKQIAYPEIKYFDHKRIDKTRVKRNPLTNAISIPIFTIDLQSAIITGSNWGISRKYLYHRNPVSKKWELVGVLWQDGT